MQKFECVGREKPVRQWDIIQRRGFGLSSPAHTLHTLRQEGSSKGSKNLSGALSTLETSVSILTTGLLSRSVLASFCMRNSVSAPHHSFCDEKTLDQVDLCAWRLGKHLNIEMTVPFLPENLGKQNACWKRAKQAHVPSLGRTGMPASPIGSAHPSDSKQISLRGSYRKELPAKVREGRLEDWLLCAGPGW